MAWNYIHLEKFAELGRIEGSHGSAKCQGDLKARGNGTPRLPLRDNFA